MTRDDVTRRPLPALMAALSAATAVVTLTALVTLWLNRPGSDVRAGSIAGPDGRSLALIAVIWFALVIIGLAVVVARLLTDRGNIAVLAVAAAVTGAAVSVVLTRLHPADDGDLMTVAEVSLAGVGAGALAPLLLARPAVRRGMVAWTAWALWVNAVMLLAPIGRQEWSDDPALSGGTTVLMSMVGSAGVGLLAGSLLLVAGLAAYSGWRGERAAALGALSGPLIGTYALMTGLEPMFADRCGPVASGECASFFAGVLLVLQLILLAVNAALAYGIAAGATALRRRQSARTPRLAADGP
jgi:hypothetical protein